MNVYLIMESFENNYGNERTEVFGIYESLEDAKACLNELTENSSGYSKFYITSHYVQMKTKPSNKTTNHSYQIDPNVDYLYFGLDKNLMSFYISEDPYETFDWMQYDDKFTLFKIGIKNMNVERLIHKGKLTKYGMECFLMKDKKDILL